MIKYNTGFKTVGPLYDETILLLCEFNTRGNWEQVEQTAYTDNLLKKRSKRWINSILGYVRKRYLDPHPPLPLGKDLAKFIAAPVPRRAKIQVLYQYICESDPLIDRLILGLIAPSIRKYGAFLLTKAALSAFLDKEANTHPEIEKWTAITKEKWQGDFYSFLRHTGIMQKAPRVEVRKLPVSVEAFAFFVYGLVDSGFSPTDLFGSPVFSRYFMSKIEIEGKLAECQVRGWLQYRSAGGISELKLEYATLRDWIHALKA